MDPHATLGVAPGASDAEIRAAYRRAAVRTHPDKPGGDAAAFKRVSAAYEALRGDRGPAADGPRGPPHPAGFASFFDSFNRFRGFGAGAGDPGPRARPTDEIEVRVPLAAIVAGSRQIVRVRVPAPCGACRGRGATDPAARAEACAGCGGSGERRCFIGGVFSVVAGQCAGCAGRGAAFPPAARCAACAGAGVAAEPETRDLAVDVPPGAPDGAAVLLRGEGSFDARLGARRDVRARLRRAVPEGVRIYQSDIHVTLAVTLEEVLGGFRREVSPYGVPIAVARDRYVSPRAPVVCAGLGLPGGDVVVDLEVQWPAELSPPAAEG